MLQQPEDALKIFLSTPSARRATWLLGRPVSSREISIHALCEEGDRSRGPQRPLRIYFYPRPPRGGRQRAPHRGADADPISIHALCEEGDVRVIRAIYKNSANFYPRPLRGGRPKEFVNNGGCMNISIHALCEEGDVLLQQSSSDSEYFYPRPPRGGRLHSIFIVSSSFIFLSTPSARRATTCCPWC